MNPFDPILDAADKSLLRMEEKDDQIGLMSLLMVVIAEATIWYGLQNWYYFFAIILIGFIYFLFIRPMRKLKKRELRLIREAVTAIRDELDSGHTPLSTLQKCAVQIRTTRLQDSL